MKIGDSVQDRLGHKWKIKEVKFLDGKRRFVCEPVSDAMVRSYRIIEVEFPESELQLYQMRVE